MELNLNNIKTKEEKELIKESLAKFKAKNTP